MEPRSSKAMATAPTLRLFYALWPDAATRAAIDLHARRVAVESGGRAVAAANLHLTLAFLGERPAAMLPELCAIAADIDPVPFSLALDIVGCWRRTGIAWLAASRSPAPLSALRERLLHSLATLCIVIDERRFVPHVTLAGRIETVVARQISPPIDWRVASFALVASTLDPGGVRYAVLKSWPDGAR